MTEQQTTRVINIRKEDYDVYIGRAGKVSDQREKIEKEKNKFGFKCRSCSKGEKITWVYLLECDYDKYEAGGALVQDCFPYLNNEQRETIKTGMCTDCQRKFFSSNYNEEDNS